MIDIGVGSGRELVAPLAAGYEALWVEPGAGLLSGGDVNGILCSAALMQLPDAALFIAAMAVWALMKPHGRLAVSLPSARIDASLNERACIGGLLRQYVPVELQLLWE